MSDSSDDDAFEDAFEDAQEEVKEEVTPAPAAVASLLATARRDDPGLPSDPLSPAGFSGYATTLTPKEEKVLAELRAAFPPSDFDGATLGKIPGESDTTFFLRFARARNFKLKATRKMIEEHIAWRRSRPSAVAGLTGVLDLVKRSVMTPETTALIQACHPRGFHGRTKKGWPIVLLRPGLFDIHRLMGAMTPKEYLDTEIVWQETGLAKSCVVGGKRGCHVEAAFHIVDLGGLGLKQCNKTTIDFLRRINTVAAAHYPETLGHMVIVNTPFFFRAIWKTVFTQFIASRTQSKIELLGHKFTDTLLQHIDADQLPAYLGGTADPSLWQTKITKADMSAALAAAKEREKNAALRGSR